MIRTELTAAGIDDPELRGAYQRCRTLNAAHGRTFFLATRLLAPDQRPPIHALYGFARYADDILDDFDPSLDTPTRAARLKQLSDQYFSPWNTRAIRCWRPCGIRQSAIRSPTTCSTIS